MVQKRPRKIKKGHSKEEKNFLHGNIFLIFPEIARRCLRALKFFNTSSTFFSINLKRSYYSLLQIQAVPSDMHEADLVVDFVLEQTKIERGRPEARSDACMKKNVQNFSFSFLLLIEYLKHYRKTISQKRSIETLTMLRSYWH
jgi:hypothetical protein